MLLLFQATATQVADSTQVVADKLMKEAIVDNITDRNKKILKKLTKKG